MMLLDTTYQGLVAAIREGPKEAIHRLAYADWLEERGEEILAELVRIQMKLTGLSWIPPFLPVVNWEVTPSRDNLSCLVKTKMVDLDPQYDLDGIVGFFPASLMQWIGQHLLSKCVAIQAGDYDGVGVLTNVEGNKQFTNQSGLTGWSICLNVQLELQGSDLSDLAEFFYLKRRERILRKCQFATPGNDLSLMNGVWYNPAPLGVTP